MRPFANESQALLRSAPLLLLGVILFLCSAMLATGEPKPVKETKLAGLRPGIDTIQNAYNRFGTDNVDSRIGNAWIDSCNVQELLVKLNSNLGITQLIVERPPDRGFNPDCGLNEYGGKWRARFRSGHGLLLHDRCSRIQDLYGEPQSVNDFTDDSGPYRTYVYKSATRGSAVRLIWEVSCSNLSDKNGGEVSRMKLAVEGE